MRKLYFVTEKGCPPGELSCHRAVEGKNLHAHVSGGVRTVMILFAFIVASLTGWAQNPSISLEQGANGDFDNPNSPVLWIRGNVNAQKAHLIENYAVPYRIIMTDMPIGQSVTLEIGYDTKHGDRHALDFLTTYSHMYPHDIWGGHNTPELVQPWDGYFTQANALANEDKFLIPAPSSVGSPVPGQPTAEWQHHVDHSAGAHVMMSAFYADITNIQYSFQEPIISGDDITSSGIMVTFTPTGSTVILAFGGHIASVEYWGRDAGGVPYSAAGISGSPYHVRLLSWSIKEPGNQEVQLAAAAVYVEPICDFTPVTQSPVCINTSMTFNVDNPNPSLAYSWSIINQSGTNATPLSGTGNSFVVNAGNLPGSFTVQLVASYTFSGNTISKICTYPVVVQDLSLSALPTPVSCFGGSDGSIALTISGGSGSYSILWSNGYTGEDPSGLTAGTYSVTVTDLVTGCSSTSSGIAVEQPSVLIATDGHADALCNGAANGSVTLTFSGGTAPYTVSFNGGPFETQVSSKIYSGLAAGSYSWTVKDANECQVSGSEVVGQPSLLIATDGHADALCNGAANGSVTLTFSGGTAPYTVSFNGGPFETQVSSKIYSGLAAGSYSWTVKDANECQVSGSEMVGQPSLLIATDGHADALCNSAANGSVTLTFSGGTAPYTVSFNGGPFETQVSSKTYSGLAAGSYSWTVKDANECQVSGSEVVGQPSSLIATDGHADALCNGAANGSVTLTFSGGTAPYTVSFNGGPFETQVSSKTYSGLAAGSYSWTVKDANECQVSGSEVVGQPSLLIATDGHADALCNGATNGSVTLTFSGGTAPYTVSFNGGPFETQVSSKTYSGLAAGSYNWTVKDANECQVSGSETVGQPSSLIATDGHADALCNGAANGSVTLTFSGGTAPYTVSFNGGPFETQVSSKIYSGLAAGSYSWTVKDANECQVSGSEVVGQPSSLIATDGHADALCNGAANGSVTLTFSGGTAPYTVSFNGGPFETQVSSKTYSGLAAGSYSWTVKDANECQVSGSETVGQPSSLIATDGHADALCNGAANGSVTLTFSGGTAPYTVSFNGGPFETQVSSKTYSGLAAGSYSWTVKDANECQVSGSEVVSEPEVLVCTVRMLSEVTCGNPASGSATVDVSGGTESYTIVWSNGKTGDTAYELTAGTHTVTVTDENGCMSECVVEITAIPCEDGYCFYTQGYYGSEGGTKCSPDGPVTAYDIMYKVVDAQVDDKVVFGNSGKTFTLYLSDIVNKSIFAMLPGGGPSAALKGAATYGNTGTWSLVPDFDQEKYLWFY